MAGEEELFTLFQSLALIFAHGNYTTYERELLAVVNASEVFSVFVGKALYVANVPHHTLGDIPQREQCVAMSYEGVAPTATGLLRERSDCLQRQRRCTIPFSNSLAVYFAKPRYFR